MEELEISLRAEKTALARAGREITEGVEERSKMRVQMRMLNIELDDMRMQVWKHWCRNFQTLDPNA